MGIVDFINDFPLIDILPTTPFTPDFPSFLHDAWDAVKNVVDFVMGPFRGVADILQTEHEVCIIWCFKFKLMYIFEPAKFLASIFETVLGWAMDLILKPLGPIADSAKSLFEGDLMGVLGPLLPQLFGQSALPFDGPNGTKVSVTDLTSLSAQFKEVGTKQQRRLTRLPI